MASGIARMSMAATAGVGLLLILYLSAMRYDRAIMLIPTWLLIIAWLATGWLTITGQIHNDIIQPALGGGLVLVVLLIGFTVMQHASPAMAVSAAGSCPTWSAALWRWREPAMRSGLGRCA